MNILITGAGGFIGEKVVQQLAENGHCVTAVVRISNQMPIITGVNFLQMDLKNLDVNLLPENIDTVITLAQSAKFREFPQEAEDVFKVNIESNFRLFQWAVGKIKRFIHISSGGIYGNHIDKTLSEDDLLAVDSPLGFYLGSKLCSEIIFQNYMHFFETAVILRPFFVYGKGQKEDMFVPRIVESVRKGTPIRLQGEQGLKINPIYVADAVVGIIKCLELEGKHIINLAGTAKISLKEMAEIIGKLLGKDAIFDYTSGQPSDYIGSNENAIQKLNINYTPFEEGIKKLII